MMMKILISKELLHFYNVHILWQPQGCDKYLFYDDKFRVKYWLTRDYEKFPIDLYITVKDIRVNMAFNERNNIF